MNPFIKLGFMGLLPVIASIALYLITKKTAFGQKKNDFRQVIYGVVFGCLAIMGTEFGVPAEGVTMNVRDAAPVCAGLIFGAPAGIIAGVMGGIERFLAASWGAGEYSKYACSIATAFSGVFAGWLRVYLFDNKKPAWYYGLATGIVAEVLHMLLLFVWHLDDAATSFVIVKACAVPMISSCGISVMLATLAVSYLGKEKSKKPKDKTSITQTFQRKLLVCVLVAFFITSIFTFLVQDSAADSKMDTLLQTAIEDVKTDVSMTSDKNLLETTRKVAKQLEESNAVYSLLLSEIAQEEDIVEIDYINERGIIVASNIAANVGYNMDYGEQSREFMCLLDGKTKELVQEYQPISRDYNISRKYAGVAIRNGFVQVAYDGNDIHNDTAKQVVNTVKNRHVGEGGFLIVCDEKFTVLSDRDGFTGQNLSATGISTENKNAPENTRFKAEIYGEPYYCMYGLNEGYYVIAAIPESEAIFSRDAALYVTIFMEVIIFTALFILVYFLIKRLVVDNIRKVNDSLGEITGGNLDVTVDVRSNEEFASLSDDINSTVTTLKHYIDEAAARIDKELEFAKTIQESALPRVFPPYPNRTEFDIWANMDPAKEVGGDFYDFYLLGEDKLAFLVADVSGKGIPAAMFMMTAKTLLKSFAETGAEVNDVLTHANEELCANNDAGMFVTAWMGILELKTGLVTYGNAGHNPPLVRKKDGSFTYLKSRPGFVLAGMEGMRYRKNELQLEPGDSIYVYTDGVTEATNAGNELYGEERLEKKLNSVLSTDAETLCREVKKDIEEFVGDAPQFDDITMLCLNYKGDKGGKNMKEMTTTATLENIEKVTEFVDEQLEELGCSMKAETQINIAIDELFSNIARYAYNPDVGSATVRVEVEEEPLSVIITFIDKGVPYDPLKNADPDTSLSAEEREVGGLGILIVKKTMDEVTYEYSEGRNILKIKKQI